MLGTELLCDTRATDESVLNGAEMPGLNESAAGADYVLSAQRFLLFVFVWRLFLLDGWQSAAGRLKPDEPVTGKSSASLSHFV